MVVHRFTLPAPIDRVWASCTDLDPIGRCLPGITLTTTDGRDFSGTIMIDSGAISLLYNGSGTILDRDDDAHLMVIEAGGQDRRGHGSGTVRIEAAFSPDGDRTAVELRTEVQPDDRTTQLDQGLVDEVGRALLDPFVACLSDRLRSEDGPEDRGPDDLGMVSPTPTAPSTLDPMGHGGPADSEPVATGDGPAGGGAQSGGASGVAAASSGTATPPGHPGESWTPPEATPAPATPVLAGHPASTLARRYAPAVLAALLTVVLIRLRRRG